MKPFLFGLLLLTTTFSRHTLADAVSLGRESGDPVKSGKNSSKTESASAQRERNIDAISDNAFILEEAYNQEPGVVQHITTATRSIDREDQNDVRSWNLSFTQEWPLWSQTHQFSYTVPYRFETGPDGNNGIQDVLLNYRYQLLTEKDHQPAIAPRLSVILPTGDASQEFGSDTYGFQTNLPISKALNDQLRAHFNAGFTYLPGINRLLSDESSSPRHDLMGYNLGAALHYAPFRKLHFLLESTLNWDHAINTDLGNLNENFAATILPGIRYALDLPDDLQIVLGAGAPIGLTKDAPDYGVLLYLSVEHPFVAD